MIALKTLNSATVLLAALLMAGCQQSEPTVRTTPDLGPTNIDYSKQPDDAGQTSPDAVLPTDPAASRLQDIGGVMLVYYDSHKQLPSTLDELASSPGGDTLNLIAPRSGREFVYRPSGLWSESHTEKCIIAYDPDLRGNMRWCLFLKPPTNGTALVVNVVAIPEQDFRTYHDPR